MKGDKDIMWNKISLRTRVTIMSAIMISIVSTLLTSFIVINANISFNESFNQLLKDNQLTAQANTLNQLYDMTINRFIIQNILFMLGIILIGFISAWFITKKALKPVHDLSATIEKIDVNDLSNPIPIPKSNDEISKLATSFNHMLDKLNVSFERQKRFVQSAAHELKTPIATILTNIEVMELDKKPRIEDYQEVIKVTKLYMERMSELVNDMLMMNIGTNEQYTKFMFSDLNIMDTDLKKEILDKNIKVIIEGDIEIKGNKSLIKRAFFNIIHNAIRYNHENGKISIICKNKKIIIKDTGIGIPNKDLDNIFEPFYCVDPSRSRNLGGSGLGLAIVKQIFDQHHFKIDVTSKKMEGTIFTIHLET